MTHRLKTYIVEDNETIRENLVATLEELAHAAVIGFSETESAAVAWLGAHDAEWNLAIVDLFLKQGSGLGVLQASANRANTQKVVVLSNYATPDIRRRCAELGVDAVFDKSNEIEGLIAFCMNHDAALEALACAQC
ncbi:MAG: response regulator [Variovorax sp.]|nr:MAG: response regulator [Variovorax sp.]